MAERGQTCARGNKTKSHPEKKKEKLARRKRKEEEAKLKMEKQLRLEEEARRRMEVSAANGIREKQMKRRSKYANRSTAMQKNKAIVHDSVPKKSKRKKKRQIRSAGERGSSSHHASKTFSEDGDNVYMDDIDSGSDEDDFGLNKGKDVDLLPKRRKKKACAHICYGRRECLKKLKKSWKKKP